MFPIKMHGQAEDISPIKALFMPTVFAVKLKLNPSIPEEESLMSVRFEEDCEECYLNVFVQKTSSKNYD